VTDSLPCVPLFSYGTLRNENVQMASFGRLLSGTPDALIGYVCVQIEIKEADVVALSGEKYHPVIIEPAIRKTRFAARYFSFRKPNSWQLTPTRYRTTNASR
jgi:hypothetical protein